MKPQDVKILIADPDQGTVSRLGSIMDEQGYQHHGFTSAEAVKTNPPAGPIHVALLSLDFGGQSAVDEMTTALKRIDRQVCVAIITSRGSLDSAVSSMRAGAYDYLAKPVDPKTVVDCVESGLARRGMFLTSAETINRIIGSRLRQIRRDRNLTTQQLADRVGVTQSQISQIETGRSAASVVTLYNISQALSLSLSELLEGI